MGDSMKIVATDGHTLNPGDNPWDDVSAIGELAVFERTAPADVIERFRDSDIAIIRRNIYAHRINANHQKMTGSRTLKWYKRT